MDIATFLHATGAKEANGKLWLPALNAAMSRFDITTAKRQASFLAQLAHESDGFLPPPMAENFNYSISGLASQFPKLTASECHALGRKDKEPALSQLRQQAIANRVYQNRYGNGDAASGDGWRYRGSGLIQLTFKANFIEAGKALSMDLVGNPDRVRNDTETAALVSAWFWAKHQCNNMADTGAFDQITKKINGGTTGETSRNEAFLVALNALNSLA